MFGFVYTTYNFEYNGEILKRKKHEAKAKAEGAVFVPYVIETYGGVGKEANTFNKIIADFGEQYNSPYSRDELLDHITFSVARAVQIGNHQIIDKGFQQAHYFSKISLQSGGYQS